MSKPLCFVIMPFSKKKDADGNEIDFDLVYNKLIRPAIEAAELEPIRADEETINGIIHKPMYERLILCDYAIADLTTANANVFYELGIRHAVKPFTTITIFSKNSILPFDLNFLRCLPYEYNYKTKNPLIDFEKIKNALTDQLLKAKKEKNTDSPVYQLVDGVAFQNSVAHEKTDIFRDMVEYNVEIKNQLAIARNTDGKKEEKVKAVDDIVNKLKPEDEETGVLIDAMLSYRAIGDYKRMISFIESLPTHVRQTVMVQEQLGFALNREGRTDEAIAVLEKVIEENGPSSETYGILGRVYKDLFLKAIDSNNEILEESYLDQSLETYLLGFEADYRDAYPGVNAVTLLALKGDRKKIAKLAPVVEYATVRKMENKKPNYWDYATLLELAVIENDEAKAKENLLKAFRDKPYDWMVDTTINNLNLILTYRKKRNEDAVVVEKMIEYLNSQKKQE